MVVTRVDILSLTLTTPPDYEYRVSYYPLAYIDINTLAYFSLFSVVTGCTDGIGRSYAKELARRGMKIVLISRNPKKLEAVAEDLKVAFDTETLMIPADFTKLDIYDGIKEKVAGLDIGVLVNNVGMANDLDRFLDLPDGEKTFQDMLLVNNMSMVRMTKMILPRMVEKGKGVVINVSSIAGIFPLPFFTVYSATKAFVDSFSRSLAYEYKDKGIHVHLVGPGAVYTKMAEQFLDRPGLTAPTPDTFARSDLRSIPKIQVTSVVTGCTDGIGLSYAKELARLGMKIVLISRNPKKLEVVAEDLKKKFDTETLMIPADFTKLDIYDGIKEKVKGLDIGVLVNNVGMASDLNRFLDLPDGEKTFQDMLLVNNMSMVRMTKMILPMMVEKKTGVVINVSSIFGIFPVPLVTIYAATKAFVDSFSRSLAYEYRDKGIHVHLVGPGILGFVVLHLTRRAVYTNMTQKFLDRPGLTAPTPDTFARSDLRSIPKIQVTSGYWFHNLMREAIRFMNFVAPYKMTNMIGQFVTSAMEKYKEKCKKQ
ncbi:unnamed protein product [Darwinula stevensoni]|uniref:Estradiol 17-beta-dehydrogenase 12 n=1 Tax=Darwinula stevensoni TaxID=69355 RepID=A0A7R8WZY0_9CRUS|nr:unnamed protein product [Darwinula stevensoni]CAG0880508.1 unnamed protein product [Darwinula stevensoni]